MLQPRDWLIAISRLKGIGRKALRILFPHIKQLSPACEVFSTHEIPSLQPHVRRIVDQVTKTDVLMCREELAQKNCACLTYFDPLYPELLKQIADFPLVLYYQGNLQLLEKPLLAIVGTRMPSGYGKRVAYQFAEKLSLAGMVVVSGMAKGIDAQAHRGALSSRCGTIAVLGCGVDVVYPKELQELYTEIKEQGLLLSEYPPGTTPFKANFPERNRIISGLCKGVVVVEAAKRSGTSITVNFALEQNRDVFAVPGTIFSPLSEGTHQLIKEGAKLVCSGDEIVEEYPLLRKRNRKKKKDLYEGVSQQQILGIIGDKQVSVAYIAQKTGLSIENIMQQLIFLEMSGQVQRIFGNQYMVASEKRV